jgi:CubicO group peptidase (beta-lactamase class C family)
MPVDPSLVEPMRRPPSGALTGRLGSARVLSAEAVEAMTSNTLPPELTPITYGSIEADDGYGFGLGVTVKVAATEAPREGPVGLFRWSGYLGTYFWVDPASDLIAMVWTQHSPGSAYPIEPTFRELVYAALGGGRR